jgi:hypothetical protein
MSVVRATTGTRVNAAGLVENVPYNLLQYSEQFDNAFWFKEYVSILPNTVVAPNGSLTADRATINNLGIIRCTLSNITANAQYSISVWVKKPSTGGATAIRITTNNTAAWDTGLSQKFTLTTNWQRVVLTGNVLSSGGTAYVIFGCINVSGLPDSDCIGDVDVWGAQFVEGSNALEYFPTTDRLDIARIDYSTGSSALLVEPGRTNLVSYSQEFSNIYWGSNFTSITKNLLSPSGIVNADTFVNNVGANRSIVRGISVVSGNTYVLSFWIKKISGSWSTSTAFQLTSFGAAVAAQTYTNLGTTITTDWVRYTHTFTATSTNTVFVQLISNEINTFGVWGAQLEAGTYSTSYIPTTSTSLTRNADVISKTGISSLIGQTEGTIFFDGVINGCQNSSANILNSERNTTASFFISYVKSTSRIAAGIYSSGTEPATFQGGSVAIGSRFKVAYAYKSGTTTLYINGVQIGTSTTTFTLPSALDDIYIGDQTTYFSFGESIQNNTTAIFKTRLTNAELAALTTI